MLVVTQKSFRKLYYFDRELRYSQLLAERLVGFFLNLYDLPLVAIRHGSVLPLVYLPKPKKYLLPLLFMIYKDKFTVYTVSENKKKTDKYLKGKFRCSRKEP